MDFSVIKKECAVSSAKPEKCGAYLVKPESKGDAKVQKSPPDSKFPSNQQTPQKSLWPEATDLSDKSPPSSMPSAATSNDRQSSPEAMPGVPPMESSQPKPTTKLQPGEELGHADSILNLMVISLENKSFSLLLSIAWFFARIPLRFFKFLATIVMLRVMWLLMAVDNGAWEIGARVDHRYNMPGVY
jgi:hypothetical protein